MWASFTTVFRWMLQWLSRPAAKKQAGHLHLVAVTEEALGPGGHAPLWAIVSTFFSGQSRSSDQKTG